MKYNFDEVIERRGTDSVKWDGVENVWGRKDLLPMWVADMDFRTPPFVMDALRRRLDHEVLGYTFACEEWYTSICSWLHKRHQWDVTRDMLTFVPGIVRGQAFALQCFTKPGDKVMVMTPVYHPFFLVTERLGREVVYSPLDLYDGHYHIDFERFSKDIRGCRLLILCNPHNPGGRVWTVEELRRIADICKESGTMVVSDEIHADLTLPPYKHHPFATVSEAAAQNSLTFMAPSKAFNMPGLGTTETMVQNPPMPNPVDVKRGEYLQRGTLPLILLAAPLAALAANAPLVAIIAATALLWLLLTLAYNTEPQLEREGKRGGERKNSDSWIRVATFPWHLVKALLLAIPRILLLVIIYMAGTAVATAALALPVHTISWYFTADWGIPVPLLNDVPFSASGLALGGFMAIGWLVTVFAPQSMMIRLGGGVLRGLKHSRPAGAPSTEVGGAPPAPVAPAPKGGGRGTVLFTIWAIITVALCAIPILGMPINWMPFA